MINTNIYCGSIVDAGFNLIWFLEDRFEEKNVDLFLSLVSLDFKRGFDKLKESLKEEFRIYEDIKLFVYLDSRKCEFRDAEYAYSICWSKRLKKLNEVDFCRKTGKAVIILKKTSEIYKQRLLLYDIQGENPF